MTVDISREGITVDISRDGITVDISRDGITGRVSYRGGVALGYPPSRSSFPPPRISYHNVIMIKLRIAHQ